MLEDKIREYVKSRRGKFEPRYRWINRATPDRPLAEGERLYEGHIHYYDPEMEENESIYEPRIAARGPEAAKEILRAIARETLETGIDFDVSVREYEYLCINGEITKVEN